MAKQLGGILGPVVGRLGPTVGYLWRGRPVFRAYVRHIRYPNTERQQVERDWFVGMVRFAATVRPALLQGLHERSMQAGMTEGNYFVLRNKQHFRRTAEGLQVDYGRLLLSEGPVAPVKPERLDVGADGILSAGFDKNNALPRSRSVDSVYLYVYDATLGRGLLSQPVRRREGCLALRLPSGWSAHRLHCYLFAVDGQGNASASAYASPDAMAEASTSTAAEVVTPAAEGALRGIAAGGGQVDFGRGVGRDDDVPLEAAALPTPAAFYQTAD